MSGSGGHLSIEEARARLGRLRPAEAARLGELAKVHARRAGPATEPDDMLNEAIARVLEGRRNWPADVPIDIFFYQVMRSISDEWRQRAAREPFLEDGPGIDVAAIDGNRAELDGVTRIVRRALSDDPDAERLFEMELEGATAAEVRRELGIDTTAYDTLRRRLRRRILTAFPDGYPL